MHKSYIPSKTCQTCQRPFSWRKKWAAVWDEVRYCSARCRREKTPLMEQPAVKNQLDDAHKSELIELAWCDRTSFDAIQKQTGYREDDIIDLMRSTLKASSFRLWRKRVSGRKQKHDKNNAT